MKGENDTADGRGWVAPVICVRCGHSAQTHNNPSTTCYGSTGQGGICKCDRFESNSGRGIECAIEVKP